MGHNLTEYGAQGAGTKRIVIGEGQMMFAASPRGKAAVRTDLPVKLVVESTTKRLFQIRRGKIAWQLHATATSSSSTRCRRMTAGALPSSKWLLTLAAWWSRHGKVAADGTGQKLFDIAVAGNGFLAASLRVAPDGMAAAFAECQTTVFLKVAEQGPPFHAKTSSAVSARGSRRNTSARSVSNRS